MGERWEEEKKFWRWKVRDAFQTSMLFLRVLLPFLGIVLVGLPRAEGYSVKGTLISLLLGVGCLVATFVTMRVMGKEKFFSTDYLRFIRQLHKWNKMPKARKKKRQSKSPGTSDRA